MSEEALAELILPEIRRMCREEMAKDSVISQLFPPAPINDEIEGDGPVKIVDRDEPQ